MLQRSFTGQGLLHRGYSDPALIPHLPSRIRIRIPSHSQLLQLETPGWSTHCFLTAFPSSPPKTQPNLQQKKQNFKSQESNSNDLICNYIQPFKCRIFYPCASRKTNYFYLQRTHPTPTFLYTCHQFSSLTFLFLLDNQGNIPSVLPALSSACSKREADSNKWWRPKAQQGRISGTAPVKC